MAFLCDEGQRNLRSIDRRISGIRSELEASGNSDAELDLIWSPSHRATDFARVVHERLQQRQPPTVILCSGDLTAIELMGGLTAYGINVPRDLCITGFDDLLTPYTNANLHMDPGLLPWRFPLTTIRQPMGKIGKTAAEVLIQQIQDGKSNRGEEHVLDVELIVGTTSIPSGGLLAGRAG
jgi:LacI family transcriptional regulator